MNVKVIVLIIIIFVIIYLLSGFAYILKLLEATNPNHTNSSSISSTLSDRYYNSNVPAQIENDITNQITSSNIIYKGNGDYKLNIDLDEKINEIYDRLKETTDGQKMLNYLKGTDDEKKEILKNMVRAEMITQYPDLRQKEKYGTAVDANEIQGSIQIKRVISQEILEVANIEKSSNTSVELQKGLVAWGDQFTLGNKDNSEESYPGILANDLNTNVYNLGFENETIEEILLRAGAKDCVFETTNSEDVTIGAEIGAQATFTARMKIGYTSIGTIFKHLDGSEEDKELECTIGGAIGTLIYQADDDTYLFTREEEGDEVTVKDGTEIILESQGGYDECIPIIWFGNNNSNLATNETEIYRLINYYNFLIDVLKNPDDYLIIIPTYYKDGSTGNLVEYDDNEYSKLKESIESTFGVHCIDLKEEGVAPEDYNGVANVIKNKLAELGYDVGEIEEDNPNAGSVTFANALPVDSEITLEYIPLGNALQPQPGTLRWLMEQDDNNIKNSALQFFSIDSVGNLIVANWKRVTTTEVRTTDGANDEGYPISIVDYDMTLVKVNYKNSVEQYTMPFDYLWTFLVMGEDQEFVNNLANLALSSKITLTLFDELTIVEDDYVENYSQENRTDTQESVTETNYDTGEENSYTNETSNQTSQAKYYNRNVVTETNKIKYRITKADVWFLNYEVTGITQQYDDGTNNTQITETGPTTEEWSQTGSSGPISSSDNIYTTLIDATTSAPLIKVSGKRDSTKTETYYSRRANITTKTTIITRGYTYSEGVTKIEEKTDRTATQEEIDTRTFNEPNFVKYYLYSANARARITGSTSWLYEALEMNGKTSDLVDITKYLIYKATDTNQGVTSMDFSAYNNTDFQDATDYDPVTDSVDGSAGGALGQVELDGSYNVDGILLSNPINESIDFVGSYSNHGAVDINPTRNGGTPVYASAAGTVTTATYHSSYGNYVVIDHGNGVSTLYAHAQSLVVSAGQTVEKGQLIMYEGSTGDSSGPHVHFEIRRNGVRNQALAEDMFVQLGFTIVRDY